MAENEDHLKLTNDQFFEVLEKKKRSTRIRKRLRAALVSLLTNEVEENLYEVGRSLNSKSRDQLGVNVSDIYRYIQDPLVAREKPKFGILPIDIRREPGLGDGPTSARFAVVDYNMDSATLNDPAVWNSDQRRFEGKQGQPLTPDQKDTFQFHQTNVWAVARSVLDFYEGRYYGMGRSIPWGFDGSRLILVPHAGFGKNAFYDRRSKSLQFYYYGTKKDPKFTCLSHDIIAHEMGHAMLDGIRPLYYDFTSVETAAFHEYIGDLTAILMFLRNNTARKITAWESDGDLSRKTLLNGLAEELGKDINGFQALRDAHEKIHYKTVKGSNSPHDSSRVLTSANYEILIRIANLYRNDPNHDFTPMQALAHATPRFTRIALQAIDLCPPMDIRFIDYARAVLHNFEIHEPYRSPRAKAISDIISAVFHEWGLCSVSNKPHAGGACDLQPYALPTRLPIYHNITDVSRSRSAAYYYINDNRKALRIPPHQDLEIVDLYGLNKYGRAAERLPREIVIEYLWREEYELEEDLARGLEHRRIELLCGGTLVLDEQGNLMSWFRKPGLDFPEPQERAAGQKRLDQLQAHMGQQIKSGMVGSRGSSQVEVMGAWSPPIVADTSSGTLKLEITPQLRETFNKQDDAEAASGENIWDRREDEWSTSF